MLIDGFTVFGTWPGLQKSHPVDELITGLQKHKLGRACTLPSTGIFLDAASGNAATLAACAQDARLIPIGTADPRVGGVGQVNQCQDQGFTLIALFPQSQGWAIESLPAQTLLRRIAELEMPLLIEAGGTGDASRIYHAVADLTMPLLLLDVSLPTLTEAIAVMQARPNTFLTTRLLTGGDTIERLAAEVGADRLVFASRFPMSSYSSAFLTAQYAALKDDERQAVMGNNLMTLLKVA
ncbi:MAG TPA: amidohydrolase family protein [Armatimonadota bacterium]|nr:amidohydrolase family protein [Armatimonadota bacterium]